jgi:uncharacterized membrane protein
MKYSFLPKFVGVAALVGALLGYSDSSHARSYDLTVVICNYTDYNIYGAIGYYDDGQKISEGWYRVRPNRCTTLGEELDGPIYLYAQTRNGDERWVPREGYATRRFCTSYEVDEDYYIRGSDCDTDDYDGRQRWFGRVVDSNDDGVALFNIWE